MANRAEVAKIVKMIEHAYGKEIAVERVAVYVRCLEDIPFDALKAATIHLITTSKWQPSISELREAAFGLMLNTHELPTAYEAWQEIKRNVMRPQDAEYSHPLIKRAIDSLGGLEAFGASEVDEEMSWRARYVSSYEQFVKRGMEAATMLPEVKEAARRLQAGRVRDVLAEVAGKHRIPEATG